MASTAPPFDAELYAFLQLIPKDPSLGLEKVMNSRERLAPLCAPETVIHDPELTHGEITIQGPDGGEIILSILRSKTSAGGARPAIYHIHGGGMVFGTRFFLLGSKLPWMKELDLTLISVEYRLAPEHPDPAPVEDCYAGLEWIYKNASEIGIDASKIIVIGGSAGGGLAAGISLMARDRKGPKIFAQMLIYPMLDDKCDSVSNLQFQEEGTWLMSDGITGWDALLPGRRGKENVSIYAAPARAKDLKGLPPMYIEVGSNEPFRDEDVAFATRLWEQGVSTELHVWPGAWHAVSPIRDSQLSID